MSPRFDEAARRNPNGDDGDARAFHQEWRALCRRVRRRFWWLDLARIEDAIGDALLRQLEQEGRDTEDAREESWELCLCSLYGDVCRNVGDNVRTDTRRRCREQVYAHQKKNWQNENFFVQNGLLAANISMETQLNELERLLEGCNARERTLVELRKAGTKDLTAYAAVLGVGQYSLEEQRRAVDRVWNCLRMKLRRLKDSRADDTDR
jgi:hypothetical protein